MALSFQHALLRLVAASLQTYQVRNFDHLRFGTTGSRVVEGLINKLASVGLYRHSTFSKGQVDERIVALEAQWEGFEWLYARLADYTSRRTLVEVMAYRILGPRHVRIGAVYDAFWRGVSDLQGGMVEKARTQRVNMLDGWLDDFILNGHGFPVRLRAHKLNVLNTFLLEQYRFVAPGIEVEAKPGDVVVDGGGCWGDTALYFAHKVGAAGGVHVFEFSPANLCFFGDFSG